MQLAQDRGSIPCGPSQNTCFCEGPVLFWEGVHRSCVDGAVRRALVMLVWCLGLHSTTHVNAVVCVWRHAACLPIRLYVLHIHTHMVPLPPTMSCVWDRSTTAVHALYGPPCQLVRGPMPLAQDWGSTPCGPSLILFCLSLLLGLAFGAHSVRCSIRAHRCGSRRMFAFRCDFDFSGFSNIGVFFVFFCCVALRPWTLRH